MIQNQHNSEHPPCIQRTGKILANRSIARGCGEIRIGWNGAEIHPSPGQFLTLAPRRYPLPLLRRPYAYSSADSSGFGFIYQIRGPGSAELAELRPGDETDWLGPLGTGFPPPEPASRPILIAGGTGIGPIFYLAVALKEHGPLVVTGAREANLLPRLHWPPGVHVLPCTEDGSAGIAGTVMDALKETDTSSAEFYTCGPAPMMEAVHKLALEQNRPCWVSVEEIMACGVGACQGCAVSAADDTGTTYQRACLEGPVFNSRKLKWDR
ncbi:MAG: hypothetical protein B0D92_04160 [Spirochaeta sp. LUC14_002_19_P3]|nr:MAG: hypothetical protein B0D92_04160 [Spirochaeta sp. LUC14_002_19_P3]